MAKGAAAGRTSVRIPGELREAHRHPEYVGLPADSSKSKVYKRLLLKGWRAIREERQAQAEFAVYESYERDPERRRAAAVLERMSLRSGVV